MVCYLEGITAAGQRPDSHRDFAAFSGPQQRGSDEYKGLKLEAWSLGSHPRQSSNRKPKISEEDASHHMAPP
jgi:hypothetical protein